MAIPWTAQDDAELTRLHATGLPLKACAREMQRSYSTVTVAGRRLGLAWEGPDRPGAISGEALRAAEERLRERRKRLRATLLEKAEALVDQIDQPTTVFNFGGRDNTFAEEQVDAPPFADRLKISQAVTTLLSGIERLEKMDADQGSVEAASMLGTIAAAIQRAADELDPEVREAMDELL